MRRCLRVFLIGLITLSLLSGPAHACWRSRQARHCRTVVVAASPAPMVWSDGCDPCGETVVVVESPCLPAADCCGGAVVMVDGAAEGVVVGSEVADAVAVSPSEAVVSQPTPAAEQPTTGAVAESKAVELERVPPQPASDPSGVRTTSNEQPLPEPVASAGEQAESRSVLADEPEMKEPAAEPAEPAPAEPTEPAPGAEEPAPGEAAEPEMKAEEPALPGDDAPAVEPEAPESENPVEPPMEEDVADPEPAPAVEPAPLEPEPAAEPKPAPVEENLFEEVDAAADEAPADDAAAGDDEEMADEPAEPAAEPVADLFGDADEPADEPEMTEDEPADSDAAEGEPAADDDAAPSAEPVADGEPATESDPVEPAEPAADPFARSEPERRWIDATGTASMVATLIEVGADGRCVLETRGRRIAVPVEKLSGHDRDYVRQAGVRLAKLKADKAGETAAAATPAPTDTAGL